MTLMVALEQPDIINDLDVDFSDPVAQAAFINDVRNIRKIREVASKLNVSVLLPGRWHDADQIALGQRHESFAPREKTVGVGY